MGGGGVVRTESLWNVEQTVTPSPNPSAALVWPQCAVFQIPMPHHMYLVPSHPFQNLFPATLHWGNGLCVLPCNVWLLPLTFSWLFQQMSFTAMLFLQSPLMLLGFLLFTCPSFLCPWGCVSYYHPSPAKSMPFHSTFLHSILLSHPLSIWPIYVVCIIAIC